MDFSRAPHTPPLPQHPPSTEVAHSSSRAASRWPTISLWLTCVLILGILWAGLLEVALQEKQHNRVQQRELAVSTAKGFAEFVGLHVQAADGILVKLSERSVVTGQLPVDWTAAELGPAAPLVEKITWLDSHGRVLAMRPAGPATWPLAAQQVLDAVAREPGDVMLLMPPPAGAALDNVALHVARAVRAPDGTLKGVVVASIDPRPLHRYFSSVDVFAREGSVMILGRLGGTLRTLYLHGQVQPGDEVRTAAAWSRLSGKTPDVLESIRSADGAEQVAVFQPVEDYPLGVAVISTLAPWYRAVLRDLDVAGMMALAFSALLVAMTALRGRAVARKQRLIEELQDSHAREQQASRLKSNFMASVSHELRTPLNSILGFSELIRDQQTDRKTTQYADMIHSSAHHLHALVTTLLDLAKIEAGRMEMQRERVNLGDLTTTLVDVHSVGANKKGLPMTLTLDLPAGRRAIAETDRSKLVQVINNVLQNAVKFTQDGAIWVTGQVDGGTFVLRVVDTGPGIAPQLLPQVFDRFTRKLDPGAHEEGPGLGLALSRELMSLLGGTITLTSENGEGTQVEIRLPGTHLEEQ